MSHKIRDELSVNDVRDIPEGDWLFHYHLDEMIRAMYRQYKTKQYNWMNCCHLFYHVQEGRWWKTDKLTGDEAWRNEYYNKRIHYEFRD